jgi:ATP-dependent RNA helicase DeaD
MQPRLERFDQFGFPPALMQRLGESGHEAPSHIQSICIPPLLAGRDLLAHTDTGTGKTLAFVLPMLANLDLACRQPQVVVLTPTDETSLHVAETFQEYAKYCSGFHVLPIYHQSATIQMRSLKRGTHIVVSTPRRIRHHIELNTLNLDYLKTVVIDEADEMVQRDFMGDIEWLLEQMPSPRQTAIFSATLPKELRQFARKFLRAPLSLRGTEKSATAPVIRQRYWQVESSSKLNALTRLIEVEPGFGAALVFVHSKAGAIDLVEKLNARGYAAAALDVDTPSPLRESVSEQFVAGSIDIVVCTDQGADQLDVTRVTHAVSFDLPCDATSHVHRIAHLCDAKQHGTAILLVTPREMGMLRSIERATRQSIDALVLPERFR